MLSTNPTSEHRWERQKKRLRSGPSDRPQTTERSAAAGPSHRSFCGPNSGRTNGPVAAEVLIIYNEAINNIVTLIGISQQPTSTGYLSLWLHAATAMYITEFSVIPSYSVIYIAVER